MGVFLLLGKLITFCPPLFAVLMPIISTVFVIVGFVDYDVQDKVGSLWVPESTEYAKKGKYRDSIGIETTSSALLVINKPNAGNNIATAQHLLEIRDRLNASQKTTVVVDGMTYYFEDVCYNPVGAAKGPYLFPCFRMTALDCFEEGKYDFTEAHAAAWRQMVSPSLVASGMPAGMTLGVQQALASLYGPIVLMGLVQTPSCATACPNTTWGLPAQLAAVLNQPAGTWESNPTCTACASAANSSLSIAQRDAVYVQSALGLLRQATNMPSLSIVALQSMTGAITQKGAIDQFLMTNPLFKTKLEGFVRPQVTASVQAQVTAMLSSKNPYSFMTYGTALGQPRPRLNLTSNLPGSPHVFASDSSVLQALSGPCYAWDGGAAIPPNIPALLYGSPSPQLGIFNATVPLQKLELLMHGYNLLVPAVKVSGDSIIARVAHANRPAAFGGSRNISEATARKVLEKFKEALENAFNAGWDDGLNVQTVSFTDDVGANGAFARTLTQVTTDSVPLIVVFGAVTAVLAALFFVPIHRVIIIDPVLSRVLMVILGSCMALLGCFAALGFSAICGIKLNVVHFWSLPFIIVGIGIDDMFMLTLSYKTYKNGATPSMFPQCYADVAIPVTLTSLVNAAMFTIMATCSDIKAVYETGYTGLIATLFLYLTMLVSFSSLVYMDATRRAAGRYECLPCLKSARKVEVNEASTEVVSASIYRNCFKLSITTVVGRIVVLLLSLGIIIPAVVGLANGIEVGISLADFAPADTPLAEWTSHHDEFFGSWPVVINWGQLAYTDPQVQLKMAQQFEQVIATDHIVSRPMPTTLVWTAAMALWGSTQTSSPLCTATWVDNTMGLRLDNDFGVCRVNPNDATKTQCPVIAGLSDEQLVKCIGNWSQEDLRYSSVGPNFVWPSGNAEPNSPLKFSQASGSVLYAYKLSKTDDYTKMIEQTRKIVDDSSLYAWMSGIPFDYWEQYLTITKVMMKIAGIAIGIGFVVSFVFLFVELTSSGVGTWLQRAVGSIISALLIAFVSALSLMCVIGYCALANIKLSGFTATSCVLSIGLAVEYSVHITHRFLGAPVGPAYDRIDFAMSWLFAPNAMAFITSAVSVVMMAFSKFEFVRLYFFAPLAIAVCVSYFFGGVALPCLLGCLHCMPALGVEIVGNTDESRPKDPKLEEPKTPLASISTGDDRPEQVTGAPADEKNMDCV